METTEFIDSNNVKSIIKNNKALIAVIGGVALGLTIASLMGNERAKQILKSAGSFVTDASSKFANNLGGYKHLLEPLLGKTQA
jgi:hypothetical protein